jgi:hypothetical protein
MESHQQNRGLEGSFELGETMKKLFLFAALVLVGCSNPPPKVEMTCPAGHGTCYMVHCESRSTQECESYFKGFCPKGFKDTSYGIVSSDTHDFYLECE